MARRGQASDQFHRYLHNPTIIQPDGVDNVVRTKAEQQQWLNTEQWEGYSETYLKRHMQYPATAEHPNPHLNPKHQLLYACLETCYRTYGVLAQQLQQLHDNPLHPQFHDLMAHIKKEREGIARELDRVYADLHPTVKTIYDAFLVRRYYHLEDWIIYVEHQRAELFEQLSPKFIQQMEKQRGVAEQYIRRLRLLETAFTVNPTLGLLDDDGQYTTDELAMLRQKAAYFRNLRTLGVNQQDSDIHTH